MDSLTIKDNPDEILNSIENPSQVQIINKPHRRDLHTRIYDDNEKLRKENETLKMENDQIKDTISKYRVRYCEDQEKDTAIAEEISLLMDELLATRNQMEIYIVEIKSLKKDQQKSCKQLKMENERILSILNVYQSNCYPTNTTTWKCLTCNNNIPLNIITWHLTTCKIH